MEGQTCYQARYIDANGTEFTHIYNDGSELRMELRGVIFTAVSFSEFEPAEDTPAEKLTSFTLEYGYLLWNCSIECDIPVRILTQAGGVVAILRAQINLGNFCINTLGTEQVWLTLHYGGKEYSSKFQDTFECGLLEVQKLVPKGDVLHICFGCMYADYHPGGQPMFGGMACFRNSKGAYLNIESGKDMLFVWETRVEFIQETYICSEFEKRKLGVGYRG